MHIGESKAASLGVKRPQQGSLREVLGRAAESGDILPLSLLSQQRTPPQTNLRVLGMAARDLDAKKHPCFLATVALFFFWCYSQFLSTQTFIGK